MRTVTKRELNQHTAQVLAQVTDDDDVVVTERGTPRWRVGAFTDDQPPLTKLEQEGRYTPPSSKPAPWADQPGGPTYTGDQVDALLDEMHGEH